MGTRNLCVYQGLSGPEGPGYWGVRPHIGFMGKRNYKGLKANWGYDEPSQISSLTDESGG